MFQKILPLKKMNNSFIYLTIIFICSATCFNALTNPQLFGEDEASSFVASLELLNKLKEFDLFGFFKTLLRVNHPPGRYLLPIPFLAFFGETISFARLPYFLIWIYSCILSYQISIKLFDRQTAFLTAIFLSCSGLFSIEIQSLGLGATVLFGLLLIKELHISPINLDLLNKNKKSLFKVNLYLLGSFLFFSTWILMVLSFYLIVLILIFKSDKPITNLKKFISKNIIFFLIYLFYYLFFLGVPIWIIHFNGLEVINFLLNKDIIVDLIPFGQYHQYLVRSNNTFSYGIIGLIQNLKHLNWYYLPLIGPAMFLISIISIFKFKKDIFYLFLSYLIIFNFFVSGRSGPHLQALYIIMLPFGIYLIKNIFSKFKFFNFLILVKFLFLVSTNYFFNLKHYDETNFPYHFEKRYFAEPFWPQNLNRPLNEIILKIKESPGAKKPVLNLIDGSISLYHGRDLFWLQKNKISMSIQDNSCIKFNKEKYYTIINTEKQMQICKDNDLIKIPFKNSYLYIISIKE